MMIAIFRVQFERAISDGDIYWLFDRFFCISDTEYGIKNIYFEIHSIHKMII